MTETKLMNDLDILKMSEYGIPDRMQGALIRYFDKRIPPGGFLTAVLSNDLVEAINRADDENVHCLKAYVMWLYNRGPAKGYGWGSPEAVADWLSGI